MTQMACSVCGHGYALRYVFILLTAEKNFAQRVLMQQSMFLEISDTIIDIGPTFRAASRVLQQLRLLNFADTDCHSSVRLSQLQGWQRQQFTMGRQHTSLVRQLPIIYPA